MPINNEALQQQLIKDLLIESYDGLDRFDREMLTLEQGQGQPETLNIVFRVIHTIKGTAGCIGLGKIESVAHIGENLLSLLRDGKRQINPGMVGALLEYSDALKEMLHCLEQTGAEGGKDYTPLLDKLQKYASAEALAAETVDTASAPPATDNAVPAPTPEATAPVWGLFADEPATAPTTAPNTVEAAAPPQATLAWGLFEEETAATGPVTPAVPPATPRANEPTVVESGAAPIKPPTASVVDSAVRVDVGQLDKLMNLVGELVLARNQILQFTSTTKEPTLLNASQRLNLITTELQESVMKTRMQPIENIWSKFPRIVRDVARELGKKVQLVMEGNDTELDRTIIEAIKDPLTHIVRNSIDHGIEKAGPRLQAGKPEEGLLVLRAFHEGGQVNLEIMDDGAGINVSRVKAKAVEKGLITAEHAARMPDREAFGLIFLPGFSTAERVTNVSGRGVGMDVVRTNIEKIGGSVDVLSEPGQGTTLKIRIPLTLAIIPALIVTSHEERFAIPQVSLLELVRLEGAAAQKGLELLYGSLVYRLRGKLLPLVSLRNALSDATGESAATFLDTRHQGDPGEIFQKARDAHRAWLARLRQVIDGELAMSPEEAGSHQHCALGKWLYAEGLKNYNGIQQLRFLEKTHEAFHKLVREILTHKAAGDQGKCEAGWKKLAGISDRVLALLVEAENRILESQAVSIVVLQADGRQFGLIVDAINDTEEIVVKPLGKQLKHLPCYAGATIMGDGRVALILDVLGLAQQSRIIAESRDRRTTEAAVATGNPEDRQTLLLFEAGANSRLAIPLSMVARLEEFPRESIERAGDQQVVQYRGQILPLIQVSDYLTGATSDGATADPMQVVVYSDRGRSIGLVVGKIHDIVEEALSVRREAPRRGIAGSAVIQERVTDLVDVRSIISSAEPDFYNEASRD